jgi:hypothetical protein
MSRTTANVQKRKRERGPGRATVRGPTQRADASQEDNEVKVVVFDSAVDGFFATHYDFFSARGVH